MLQPVLAMGTLKIIDPVFQQASAVEDLSRATRDIVIFIQSTLNVRESRDLRIVSGEAMRHLHAQSNFALL